MPVKNCEHVHLTKVPHSFWGTTYFCDSCRQLVTVIPYRPPGKVANPRGKAKK